MRIKEYLTRKIEREGAIHLSLIDPVEIEVHRLPEMVLDINESGSSGIMIGGSTLVDSRGLYEFVNVIKKYTNLPVILFPNNVSSIVPNVDAIWFMSLLNSRNPYYITGAQMLAAPLIKKYGIEPLPMGYIIVGEESSARFIGDANPVPRNKPEIAAAYALAGRYLGMEFIYLEAGSGVQEPLSPSFVSTVRKAVSEVTLIVGGGIRSGEQAYRIVKAGADIIITGTVLEQKKRRNVLMSIVESVKKAGESRRRNESR